MYINPAGDVVYEYRQAFGQNIETWDTPKETWNGSTVVYSSDMFSTLFSLSYIWNHGSDWLNQLSPRYLIFGSLANRSFLFITALWMDS